MVEENIQFTKQKLIFKFINIFKSSFANKYCLFCRTEIIEEDHFCDQVERIGDKLVAKYL